MNLAKFKVIRQIKPSKFSIQNSHVTSVWINHLSVPGNLCAIIYLFTGIISILNLKLKTKGNHPKLPDPNGPLSVTVPSSTIVAVNKKVSSAIERSVNKDESQGPYLHLTPEQKYRVGKRAAEFGVTNTL